jgi:hypothetical protein
VRIQQAAKEARDQKLDALRAKYAPKLAALEEKIRRAEQAVAREEAEAQNSAISSAVRFGTTILDAVMGRRSVSKSTIDKAGTAIRQAGRSVKESGDVTRARETLSTLREQYLELDTEFRTDSELLALKLDPLTETLETVAIRPKKMNITPRLVAFVWAPAWCAADGSIAAAWDAGLTR